MIDYSDVSASLADGISTPTFATDPSSSIYPMPQPDQEAGFEPLKTLPAQFHNWLLQRESLRNQNDCACLDSLVREGNNVLELSGETPDEDDNKQLKKFFGYDETDQEGGAYVQEVIPKEVSERTSSVGTLDTANKTYALFIAEKDSTDPDKPVYSMKKTDVLPLGLGGTGATTAQGIYDAIEGYIRSGITPALVGHKLVFGTI